jgi:hypothetical protein
MMQPASIRPAVTRGVERGNMAAENRRVPWTPQKSRGPCYARQAGTASVSGGGKHSITFHAVLREFVPSNRPQAKSTGCVQSKLLHSVPVFISKSRCTKKSDGVIIA